MKSAKKIVNILAISYLIFAALIVFNILNRSFFINLFNQQNLEGFYTVLFMIGCVLLLLELVTEALYIRSLKRENQLAQLKINELKAKLYDQKLEYRDIRTTPEEPMPEPEPAPNVARTIHPDDRGFSAEPYPPANPTDERR